MLSLSTPIFLAMSLKKTTVCNMIAVLIVTAATSLVGLLAWLAFCFLIARLCPQDAVRIIEASGKWLPVVHRAKHSRRRDH